MPLTGEIEEQYGEKSAEVAIWRPVFEMDALVERVARAMFRQHHESQKLPVSEQAWAVTGSAWRACAQTAINTLTKKPPAVGPAAEVNRPLGESIDAAIT